MITALKGYLLHAAGIFLVFLIVFITYNAVSKSKSKKSVSLKADLKRAVHSKVVPSVLLLTSLLLRHHFVSFGFVFYFVLKQN